MLLLTITITSFLMALLYLALVIAGIYIVLWILGLLGIVLPDQIRKIAIAIIIILCLIWLVRNFI
jgi:hypothetical protein